MPDNMLRAISENGGVVICALDSTGIVQQMEAYHHTSAVVSAALGRMLTAASLMASWLKNPRDSITLRVNGGGPVGTMVVVTDGEGNVRGYASNPVVEIPLREDGKLDVGSAVGNEGTLSVIRDLGLKEPYIGQTPLVSGEIGEDITAYYAASEQTPTVCALGVLVNADLSIKRAGGFLLQLLPGATDDEVEMLERNIAQMPSVTELLDNGGSVEDMVQLAMKGFAPQELERRTTAYRCYCNEEKTKSILASLGEKELASMLAENPVATVECHFCNRSYHFDLNDIMNDIPKASEHKTS